MHQLLVLLCASSVVICYEDSEVSMNSAEMIEHWGYPVESHDVITEDGYILSLLRIRHGRHQKRNSSCHRPPVMFVHGLFCDSSEFVSNPFHSSPGMIMADAGFDVFLLNVRGTPLSQRHINLKSNDEDFWKFTHSDQIVRTDDMAKYDAPAAIDRALELNGATSLHWIGHSQIRTLMQLTPVGTLSWVRGLFKVFNMILTMLKPILRTPQEIGVRNGALVKVAGYLCPPTLSIEICKEFLVFLAGPPAKTFNWTRGPVYLSKFLVSTSSWNLLQYLQNSNRKHEYHFDVSPEENLRRYGNVRAPRYNYSNIDSDVYLFWSRNDWITQPQEIEQWLMPRMKHGVIKATFEIPEYNHADFAFANDVADRVFRRIIEIIRKYESNACIE